MTGYLTDNEVAALAAAAAVLAKHGERKLSETLLHLTARGSAW